MPAIIKNDMGEPVKTSREHSDIVWARIDSVVTLILENARYMHAKRSGELAQIVMKNFSLQERQAKYYVSEAKKEIRRIGVSDKKKAFVRAIQDREFLFQKAKGTKKDNKVLEKPDYKLALEIVKDRDKLFGLYVDETKGEMTIKNVDMSKFTEYGLERLKRGDKIEDVLMDPKAVKGE
jgi:hypothetical protein